MAMAPQMKEAALAEYLDECQEMLERLTANLGKIEKGAPDKNVIAAIYRDMHTIKGTSQLFGFLQIGQLAHALETCLDPVRKSQMQLTEPLVDSLYAGIDFITNVLRGIREKKQEPDMSEALKKLLPQLVSIAEGVIAEVQPTIKDKSLPTEELARERSSPAATPRDQPGAETRAPSQQIAAVSPSPLNTEGTVPAQAPQPPVAVVTNSKKIEDEIPGFHPFDDEPPASAVTPQVASVAPVAAATREEKKAKIETGNKTPALADDQQAETIRVQVTLLDSLMNLVGELVLIRNQLLQQAKLNDDDTDFLKVSQRLNILTAELQNEVMKTRMQPIGNILNKFTRVVRDLGKELGKKIDLDLQGAETELDKTIIEAVKDPLTHIVRNAVDHGIESASDRKAAGKNETGIIRLKAYHESGQVIIEIIDDGRGLDRQRIGGKAIEKGLITSEAFAKMTDKEVQGLIFAPGFSTASLSSISGRGVGMDVVRTNVEKIGGVVDVVSVAGSGTTIKLRIPLTLAIVPALIVRASGQRFAIPQTKLVQLLRIDGQENGSEGSGEKIEMLQGRPVLRLRGKLLPIIDLTELLLGKAAITAGAATTKPDSQASRASNVVVLNADNFYFGLIVDEIDDSADIVVKSLSNFLKDINVFSGATILGDGSVALTIDVMGISETARLAADGADTRSAIQSKNAAGTAAHRVETTEFLLIDVGAPASYGIPLTLVSRIEEFENSRFEYSGEQRVIRYRDALLPIFSLPEFLDLPFERKTAAVRQRTPVVVIKRGDHSYGIEVCEIQDIVAVEAKIDDSVKDRKGILGSLIAGDQVIVVVDIFEMLDSLKARLNLGEDSGKFPPQASQPGSPGSSVSERRRQRILVVEDSSFFRNYVRQVLNDAGYTTEVACDGAEGYATLENAPVGHFSLVLSDIEMPNLDGYELARKIRATAQMANLPLFAITTRFSTRDIENGYAAGFTKYLEKLNAENLLTELDAQLLSAAQTGGKRASNS